LFSKEMCIRGCGWSAQEPPVLRIAFDRSIPYEYIVQQPF
jgi:hypothetical protein